MDDINGAGHGDNRQNAMTKKPPDEDKIKRRLDEVMSLIPCPVAGCWGLHGAHTVFYYDEGCESQKDKGKPAVGELVPNGVAVVGLLPDPVGRDEGHEAVEIGNSTAQPVDLAGWKLRDRAGNEYRLSGNVASKGRLRIVMTKATMSLNNDGDTVLLIDPAGVLRCRVEYTAEQVRAGKWVESSSR